MATAGKLQGWFPHAQTPIIISAPMLGPANGVLAAAVSKAGGVGMDLILFSFCSEILIRVAWMGLH